MPDQVRTLDEQLRATCARFEELFGRKPTLAAAAPGRVNLIGEHTDYNDGFVLPMAIQRQTVIVADRRDDQDVCIRSTAMDGEARFHIEKDLKPGEPSWSNYIRGAVAGCLNRGMEPGGFDALVDSTVPSGGGLSSSASIEVATATLVQTLASESLDPVDKALLCQEAEHQFAGVPCGIMDQFISTMGRPGSAMLIDCRSLQIRMVPLSDPAISVLIVNSNVKHQLSGGEYGERRAQCEAAAKTLGVKALRDATLEQLEAAKGDMDATAYRRARHVISENERTVQAADAMAAGNWAAAGKLMLESHASLRDDFEVSCDELDTLVDLATELMASGDVIGSRMTGGGFGGCTVSLVRADAVEEVSAKIAEGYKQKTGIDASLFATRPAAGARVLEV